MKEVLQYPNVWQYLMQLWFYWTHPTQRDMWWTWKKAVGAFEGKNKFWPIKTWALKSN